MKKVIVAMMLMAMTATTVAGCGRNLLFLRPLTSKQPAKQAGDRDSAGLRA